MMADQTKRVLQQGRAVTRQGWQCPACGKVWAPFVTNCDCHRKRLPVEQKKVGEKE